jgi:hypothetical protein
MNYGHVISAKLHSRRLVTIYSSLVVSYPHRKHRIFIFKVWHTLANDPAKQRPGRLGPPATVCESKWSFVIVITPGNFVLTLYFYVFNGRRSCQARKIVCFQPQLVTYLTITLYAWHVRKWNCTIDIFLFFGRNISCSLCEKSLVYM